eukprot:gene18864-biopygen14510
MVVWCTPFVAPATQLRCFAHSPPARPLPQRRRERPHRKPQVPPPSSLERSSSSGSSSSSSGGGQPHHCGYAPSVRRLRRTSAVERSGVGRGAPQVYARAAAAAAAPAPAPAPP